ncbi:MAG: FKBP-type peptidyl-prolyl cis-trans isomerase [Pyrinomonadaceae bacterium]|nr:FKBP-type peptidyl-prolyl cis-trans isomerase [Sphingobacteriaceae bacterium]
MKYNLYKVLGTLSVALVLFSACTKEYEGIEAIDQRNIREYIQKNSLTGFRDTLGIHYQIITPGTGSLLNYTDKVFATFSAKSLDGTFDLKDDGLNRFAGFLGYFSNENGNNYPKAFSTAVKEILKKKGGTIRIIVPSQIAYGRDGNASLGIPGNASLDCIVKIYNVNNNTEFEDLFVKKYISDKNITGLSRLSSGLYYQILTPGSGDDITAISTVTVAYKGMLTTGTVFDQSTSFKTDLSSTIPGWIQGVPLIKKGGKIRLIIPPSLAYGSQVRETIPPYSILDFDIEILEVN